MARVKRSISQDGDYIPAIPDDVGNPGVGAFYNDRGQCWRVVSRVNRWRADRSRAWVAVKFGLYAYDRVYADNVIGLYILAGARSSAWRATYGLVLTVPGLGAWDLIGCDYCVTVVGCVWDVAKSRPISDLIAHVEYAAWAEHARARWASVWDYLTLEWRGF